MTVCVVAYAADDAIPDPSQSLHPYRAIATLAALRQPLDAAPNDQRLLGLALMGYVNLCLAGEAETNGNSGPWLDYAQQIAARRVQGRQGRPAATLAEAAPELWVQAMAGENAAVETALARWPDEHDTPHHRALHTLATGDWRAFSDHPPTTLHERYALLHAGFVTNARKHMSVLEREEHDHNPFLVSEMQWRASQWGDPPTIVAEAVAATAWMLRGRELTDDEAVAMLGELITACAGQPPTTGSRDQALRAAASTCTRIPHANARAVGTAYHLCERLLDKEHGIMGSDGKHRLFGLGDLAAWSRDRLYLAAFYGYLANREHSYDDTDRSFCAFLRQTAPDSVLATRYTLGHQGTSFAQNDQPSAAALDAAAAALSRELERPRCHHDSVLIIAINKLAKQRPELATPLLRALLGKHPAGLGRAGLLRAVDLAADCGVVALVLPALRRAVEHDPWDVELYDLLKRWSPDGHLLTFDGLKPKATWDDAEVDNTTLPWPHLEENNRFAIRWQGSLHVTQAGTYVVAVESDDDSRLYVGDTVVDNSGQHGMQLRQIRSAFTAGWAPVRLEFHQGGGQAGCRFLWQPPGADHLEPVPADHLAHGDNHAPGLHAEGFALGNREDELFLPSVDEVAYARGMPWHLRLQARMGDKLFDANRYKDAIPFFTAACIDDGMRNSGIRLGECQAWQDPPDIDASLATLRRFPSLSYLGWEYGYHVWRFRQQGRINDLFAVLKDHLGDQLGEQFLPGFAALDRVDLTTARNCFRKIVDGYQNLHIKWTDLNEIRLHWAVLERLSGKEPDWAKLRGEIRNGQGEPWHELVLDYLSGAQSWDACKTRMPAVPDGEDLLYFRALVDLTTGEHAAAKAGFADILNRHPTWYESPTSRDILAWYEHQTEESLAKLPKAKPITPAAKAKVDNSDF